MQMAQNVGVNFNGQMIVHPGAYSTINANALSNVGSQATKTVVFVGSADGGQPGVVHWFDNPADAADVLKGGDLLLAGKLAWAPSGDGIGAQRIGFIRAENATPATLTQGSLTLTAIDYGVNTNKLQALLTDGTLAGSKKLQVSYWPTNTVETYDNLGPIFTVQYTGTNAVAQLTITTDSTSGKATQLQISTGASAGSLTPALTYDLTSGQWANVNQIVADIAAHPDFTATMVTVGNKNVPSNTLDAVSAQDIKTAPYTVTAFKGDLLLQIATSELVKATFANGTFPTNFGPTYFTGGSNGTVPVSWASLFNLLAGEDVDIVVPLTASEAIHAEAAQFVESQSTKERSPMVGFYGGDIGESVDETINRAIALNSSRAVLCYPGITVQDVNNNTVTLPSYFTAAMIAGRVAGLNVGESVTFNYLNLIGLEKILSSDEINRLIQGGVTVVEYNRNRTAKGFRVAQGITTWQVDNNPVFREISVRMLADALDADLRNELEIQFVGKKGTIQSVGLIKNAVQSYLDKKVKDEWIVDYDPNSVTVVLVDDVVTIQYAAQPVDSINYILMTTNFYRKPITA